MCFFVTDDVVRAAAGCECLTIDFVALPAGRCSVGLNVVHCHACRGGREGDEAVFLRRLLGQLARYDLLDLREQIFPCRVDIVGPIRAEQLAQRVGGHAEERHEQIARRAVGIMGNGLARDHAQFAAALARKIQDRVDGEGQHRSLHELAALTAKHRDSFWIGAMRALINERRQIFATRGRKLKTVLNEIDHAITSRHSEC